MKFAKQLIPVTCLMAVLGLGCSTAFDDIKHSDGSADFSRLVAVGGSYMAGYCDAALYRDAQENSVPALVASRLAYASGGSMIQPLVKPGVGVGLKENAMWQLDLVTDACGAGMHIAPLPVAGQGDLTNFNWLGSTVRFNNLAVPHTRVRDVTRQEFGNPSPFLGNPFYARFASNPGTSTITGDALLVNPTFAMVWIGLDDIYDYARTGGNQGGDSITSLTSFSAGFDNLVDEITSQNSGGVLLNIPSINTLPFFNHIAYNSLQLTAAEAANLNAVYAIVDPAIHFNAGSNRYVIADASEPTGRRQIVAGEYLLMSMPYDSLTCYGWGTTSPIPARYVLDVNEVSAIESAILSYNAAIASVSVSRNLALADIRALFNRCNTGLSFNGATYSTQFPEGGVFSSDGFHPSRRGFALVANEVIETINRKYAAKVPLYDVNSIPGISLP